MHNKFMNSVSSGQFPAALLVFALPCLGLVTRWGVNACSFLFLLSALFYCRRSGRALRRAWPQVRWVAAAFLLHFLVALVYLWIRPEMRLGTLEEPLRMLLCFSAMALVLAARPHRNALWLGLTGGTIAAAIFVGYQRFALGIDRPGGLINAITAGDLLMCMGLMSLAALFDARGKRDGALPAAGALAGIAGAVITGTRGSTLALVLAALALLRYRHLLHRPGLRTGLAAALALATLTCAIPQTGVQERARQAMRDVTAYMNGGSVYSQVGLRLELWRAAGLLIAERPLFGAAPAQVRDDMAAYARQGRLDPAILESVHFHNDALQALVYGGVPGLMAWLAILLAPLVFFARALRSAGGGPLAPAVAGMLLVLGFFAFGLTEVIFWSMKASLFYALMAFVLMGLCLNAQSGANRAHCARMLP